MSAIRRLNDLIRQELGGEEVFAWKYSEDLTHYARAINPDTGALLYNYRCNCGLNKNVHGPDCGMTVAEPVYIKCLLRPEHRDQWVLCKLHPSPPEHVWLRMFGTYLQWPKGGTWMPCDPVWLEPGEHPDDKLTWEVIYAVRQNRAKTYADRLAEGAAEVEKRDKSGRDRLLEQIREDAYLPFGALPGRKDGVSHGGTKDLFKETICQQQ